MKFVKEGKFLNMRILLTGHKGYIGAMVGPILLSTGHAVVGLDTNLFTGCDFGEAADIPEIPQRRPHLPEADRLTAR